MENLSNKFDWKGLVDAAIRIRKEKKLNQKNHAKLAGVSIQTMHKFEDKSTNITMENILKILDSVGLVNKEVGDDLLKFQQNSESRWIELVNESLSKINTYDQIAEFNRKILNKYGYFTFTLKLSGDDFKKKDLKQLTELIEKLNAYESNLGNNMKSYDDKTFEYFVNDLSKDVGGNYYMRVSTDGFIHFHKGYYEDNFEGCYPGIAINVNTTIRRTVSMIDFFKEIVNLWGGGDDINIDIFLNYQGLKVRRLASDYEKIYQSANKNSSFSKRFSLKKDQLSKSRIGKELVQTVYDILKDLFLQFDGYELTKEFISKTKIVCS